MSRKRSVLVICRFGGENGWGHVIRSAALCQHALSEGWETELCTSSEISLLPDEIRRAFSRISQYDQLDMGDVLEKRGAVDVLLIDEMYQPDAYYNRARFLIEKHPSARLVAIDDLGERSLEAAHLVVNTELGLRSAKYKSTKSLLGERYALVRQGFAMANAKDWPANSHLVPVLIMVGGTDPYGWTERTLIALSELETVGFAPWVISGDGEVGRAIQPLLNRFTEFEYKTGVGSQDLGSGLLTCRLGIIGCGSSVFEFAALKRKFIGLCVADNQEKTARKIETEWRLPVVYPESRSEFKETLSKALGKLLPQVKKDCDVPYSKVDLLGPQRVLEAISRL